MLGEGPGFQETEIQAYEVVAFLAGVRIYHVNPCGTGPVDVENILNHVASRVRDGEPFSLIVVQKKYDMAVCRNAAAEYAEVLDQRVPEGPDKTYLLRKLREVAMWANVAITQNSDGSPRAD